MYWFDLQVGLMCMNLKIRYTFESHRICSRYTILSFASLLFVVLLVFSCFVSVFSDVSLFVSGADATVGDKTVTQYTVTVRDSYQNSSTGIGTGAGSYSVGTIVLVVAGERWADDYIFSGWTVNEGGVTLSNSDLPMATFTMPANNVIVTANWRYLPGVDPVPTNSSSSSQQIIPTPSDPALSELAPSDVNNLSDDGQSSGGGFNLLLIIAVVVGVVVGVLLLYLLKGRKKL